MLVAVQGTLQCTQCKLKQTHIDKWWDAGQGV